MLSRTITCMTAAVILFGTHTQAQSPPAQHSPPAAPSPALPDIARMIQATNDLRLASEAIAQFGKSLEKITPKMAEATVATSHEMALISDGFDPFGFKTSYRVIHEQNKVIQEQNEIIRKLQQAEIMRLRMELKKERGKGKGKVK